MKSFIRAAEVWLPSQDGTLLEFGAGLFGEAKSFAATSRAMCFGRAEGLPGDAWDQGHPILLKQFEGAHFRRAGAAKLAGLTCAVALPFFVNGALCAVLVLFGSDDLDCTGAIELWRNDPRISSDMTLVDGYYGGLPAAFEAISRDTYLPRGTGLPGLAWQRDEAVIMGELGEATRFLRGEVANDAGICRGVAMPCSSSGHASYVLTLLSGQNTPIARRTERWLVDRSSQQLRMAGGFCEVQGQLNAGKDAISLQGLDDAVAKAVNAGQPALLDDLAGLASAAPWQLAAQANGAVSVVCVPVLHEEKTTELVVLYL